MMVVQTRDATLVAPLSHAQDVGVLAEALKHSGRREADSHSRADHHWGVSDVLWRAGDFDIRHITILPGEALKPDVQRHAKHWIVVRGTATVTLAGDARALAQGQSAAVSPGMKHDICNTGGDELHVVEIQLGENASAQNAASSGDNYDRVGQSIS